MAKPTNEPELKSICVHLAKPSSRKPGGVSVTGYYIVVDDTVIMTRPDGIPVSLDGRKYRQKIIPGKDRLNEREIAGMLTKEIRSELKKGSGVSRVDGFTRPISYPEGY